MASPPNNRHSYGDRECCALAFDRKAYDASIKAANRGYPVVISGIIDWCNRDQRTALVIADLVYLAGLPWLILIPGGKQAKQAVAGLMRKNVIVSCSWRKVAPKPRF